MNLTIDAASPTPPFEQLRVAVLDAIAAGELVDGAKLPTVRGLAGELGLAVNTVARAYRELEGAGVIETRGRAGSFVSLSGDAVEADARAAALAYVAAARRLGLSRDAALARVSAAWLA